MKRYLTGVDWVVNGIDYAGKAQSGIGNHSELVLELKTSPNHQELAKTLNSFSQKFPLLTGYPSRAINLCPYWKTPLNKKIPALRLDIVKLAGDSQYLSSISMPVNAAFKNKREHLVFTLVETGKRTFLAITFDHRILDAKGAEAFLNLFQQYYENQEIRHLALTCPPHLNKWKEKFLAGRQINRFLLNLTKETPRTLPFDPKQEPCKFKTIHLNPEQSERLTNKAYAQAGYLMFMPYALAVSIQIMHRIFQEKNISGSSYLIPVPMDTRAKEEAQKEALFNHFSFFIFKIDADKVSDLAWLSNEIKNQMYEQVKNRIPEAIVNASFLMRIASLPLTNFFIRLMSKKNFASFSFSYLSNAYQQNKFMQEEILNIFHLPRTPKPPGIGVFFNQFDNKLNITLSYFDDLLNARQVEQITKSLEALGNE
ncbi:MAG TPA: hypothetical protein PKI44_06275 [Candidatus Omnitrophota bacterium]|nr:hypothetical protein [Candidatus Omnitrophota bacterium]